METYNLENNRKRKMYVWPYPGTSAIDILNTDYQVIVTTDIFGNAGFHSFYQEWIEQNRIQGKEKKIYVSSIECQYSSIPYEFKEVQFLQFKECDDYISFFQHVKHIGKWVFLTETDQKAEYIVKMARKTGIFLRVYKLNQAGKLQNCRLTIKKEECEQKKTPNEEAFSMPNQIAPVQKVKRISQDVPQRGNVVYTSDNQLIRLESEFISNSQSITYQTDRKGVQAKIYQAAWLNISYFEEKAKLMVDSPVQCEGICWPIELLHNAVGEFVGILVPEAEGYQLKQQLMSQQGLEKHFPDWDRRNLTHLTKVILDKIVYLQSKNVLFGLVNPSAIFVKDEEHVYFAEMDTYQIEGYPILSFERVMQAPELQDVGEGLRLYTKQQDNYGIALLIFMLLMPGKFPYNKGTHKNISESIKNMNFAFRYGKYGEEHGAREYYGLWRFAWSHLGNELKQAFYNTFQHGQDFSIPEKRRNAYFWKKKVEKLEEELSNPYDMESRKIFPRTFKRFNGMRTIRCIKCEIEHPDFYYRYPEKKICNSCLGKPSNTNFLCKSCNKIYYYDFGTLFKYEKLVETKDFSMPTHCPYCRSDKQKCMSCGKIVPVYRINSNNMCYDCAKIARERVVKSYSCECGRSIKLTQGQVDFYTKKFGNLPQRCEQCRKNRRSGY